MGHLTEVMSYNMGGADHRSDLGGSEGRQTQGRRARAGLAWAAESPLPFPSPLPISDSSNSEGSFVLLPHEPAGTLLGVYPKEVKT